jgi:hypothetical protein
MEVLPSNKYAILRGLRSIPGPLIAILKGSNP